MSSTAANGNFDIRIFKKSDGSLVGGITGNNKGGTVKNCFSMADIYSRSVNTPSGISGKTESNGSVINCYSLITPVAKNDGGNDYMVILGIRYR